MRQEEPKHEVARLYDSFGASLYRYALMILADREAAEDVIQQVFVALLDRGVRRIRDEERYLRQAVRNACYSALRHKKVRISAGLTAIDEVLLETVATAGESAVSIEARLAMEKAIRELSADQREVLHLHVFEGRTFREIADTIGDPANTIASRYRYALDKLRATLTDQS
jgi:RNA polymerase sigma-70 factor, ECF subfamily